MYFTALPDHSSAGFDEAQHFSQFGRRNIIFKATASQGGCDRHVGCLSIKTVLQGMEWYGVGQQHIAVRPGQFLVLNDDQEYACRVDRHAPATILSAFFGTRFAASVLQDILHTEASALDHVNAYTGSPPEFFQTLNPVNAALQRVLTHLATLLDSQTYHQDQVDECLVFALRELLYTQQAAGRRVGRVRSVKAATRLEVYKRLCVAKDFMHAAFMGPADLASISQAACMSVPQLVRQFKAAFHTTPHQYLTQIRLSHAAALLQHADVPVQEVAAACGFEDTSAFCRLFKQAYGTQPLTFRAGHFRN